MSGSETEDNGVVYNLGGTEDDQVTGNPDNEYGEVVDDQEYEDDNVVDNPDEENEEVVDNPDEENEEAMDNPDEENEEAMDNPDEENEEAMDNPDEADTAEDHPGAEDKVVDNPDDDVVYNPGDVIQEWEEPFVKILTQAWKGRRCDNCFKETSKLNHCGHCTLMNYCSSECQKSDWAYAHSIECESPYFRHPGTTEPGGTLEFMQQMGRLLAVFEIEAKKRRLRKCTTMYDGTTRTSDDFVSHQNEVAKEYTCYQNILTMCKLLNPNLGMKKAKDKKALLRRLPPLFRVAGVWKINGVSIVTENHRSTIGYGIYMGASYFDHSCRPNATINFKGIHAEVRAIAPIKRGEVPTVSYLRGHHPQSERFTILKDRYHFECKCPLCTAELEKNLIRYTELEGLRSYKPLPEELTWKVIFDVGQEEILLLRKLYLEYDERISNKLLSLLVEMVRLEAPKDVLQNLLDETEVHLKITFGEGSGFYKMLYGIRREQGLK